MNFIPKINFSTNSTHKKRERFQKATKSEKRRRLNYYQWFDNSLNDIAFNSSFFFQCVVFRNSMFNNSETFEFYHFFLPSESFMPTLCGYFRLDDKFSKVLFSFFDNSTFPHFIENIQTSLDVKPIWIMPAPAAELFAFGYILNVPTHFR